MKLTIFSVALILLTYLFRVILKEWLNDLRERIGSAETLFRTELNSTVLQLQVTKLQMDIDAERGKSALLKAKRTGNFSSFIINDRLAVASRRGKLGESEQSVLRVLKALPRRSRIANMKLFEPIQGKVKEAIEEAIKAEKASLLPNSGKDWTDSGLLKIQVMKLALVEILVAVFADGVLKLAVKQREAAEHLYRICKRIEYCLYVVGVGLTLFGIKTLVGGE